VPATASPPSGAVILNALIAVVVWPTDAGGDRMSGDAALAGLSALIAVSALAPSLRRPGLAAAAVVGAALWVFEDFGGILTGQGTDPNSGLLLILLAVTFWPFASLRHSYRYPHPLRAGHRFAVAR